jgi:hypothetical protein
VAIALVGIGLRFTAHLLLGGSPSAQSFFDEMCNWDCGWYASVSEGGYQLEPIASGQANWAFFPVAPIGLWLIRAILPISAPAAGFILGTACALATAVVARPLFKSAMAYWLFCIFILAGPFSYAYATGMSEPPFLLLATLVFVGLHVRNYALVAIAAALLSATRVTGVLIEVALAWHLLRCVMESGGGTARLRACVGPVITMLSAPLGLIGLMAHQYIVLGDPLAFLHVQSAWGRSLENPIANIYYGLIPSELGGLQFAGAIFALLGLSAAVALALRRHAEEALFVSISILVSASTGLISMARFVIGLSPVTVIVAELLSGGRVRFVLSAVSALILCVPFAMMWMGGAGVLT